MDLLRTLVDILADATRRIWPGVAGGTLLGYLASGWGMWGFVLAAALGAFAGTWLGAWAGLVRVPTVTGVERTDLLISAGGALLLVSVGYFLVQFAMLLVAAAVVVMLAATWLAG